MRYIIIISRTICQVYKMLLALESGPYWLIIIESGFHQGSVHFVVRNTNELLNQEDGNENL